MYLALLAVALADPMGQELTTPDKIAWKDGPAALEKGAKMAVLDGDPTKDGPFVIRIRIPDGFRFAPHTHPKDERVTIMQGTLHLGMGGKVGKATAMPVGSFGLTGAGMPHFGWVTGETILQVHGVGPWAVTYLNPADDPRLRK